MLMYIYYTKNPLKSIKQTTISQNNHFKVASTKLEHRKPLNKLRKKIQHEQWMLEIIQISKTVHLNP